MVWPQTGTLARVSEAVHQFELNGAQSRNPSKKFSRKYHAIVRLLGSVGRYERNGALRSGSGS
jgi:hypothetical protein